MSGFAVGTQLEAPEGYRELEKGKTYYFLRSSAARERVLMVEFLIRPAQVRTHNSAKRPERTVSPIPFPKLVVMSRSDFESGVLANQIVRCHSQHAMPPWLLPLEGLDLSNIDLQRKDKKRRHLDRIDEKLTVIFPLIQDFIQILDSDDPDKLINSHARSLDRKQNETRVRLWFYTYLIFGRNRFSLMYPLHRLGHADRMSKPSSIKRGRPPSKGRNHGVNVNADMRMRMIEGYRRECGLGISMKEIYTKVMRKDFGCRTREVMKGQKKLTEIFHPDGAPFPKAKTFEYHIVKEFGRENVTRTLIGKVRARSKITPSRGSFTERTWNLMQRVERDAYAVKELARGLVEGSPLPPLYVVVKRDTASGLKTGIGFSQGGEQAAAYRMASFCEAVDKVRFCRFFGIEITPDRWPSIGSAPVDVQDRGAGATPGAVARSEISSPVITNMAPSYSGQSKAVVESSHPKSHHDEEAPHFVQSNLRPYELVRREIFELLRFNESCYIGDRVAPDLIDKLSQDSPNGLWNLLDSLGRNDGVLTSFEDSVRSYLDQHPAKLTTKGVELNSQIYKSDALIASGALHMVTGRGDLPVKVYVLDACIRYIWMDWNGKLLELDLTFPVPVGNEIHYMSLAELRQLEAILKERKADHLDHQTAVDLKIKNEFKDAIGKEWSSGQQVNGRPKRGNRTARQEAAEAKASINGGKKTA